MTPVSHKEFERIVAKTWNNLATLAKLKGGEYSGDLNRLENFQRNARALGLQQETIWAIYAAKHWDAIMQYVQDQNNAQERTRAEPLSGRVDDLILYLLLFKAMLPEEFEP